MTKSIEQQIATMQNKLNSLRKKKVADDRRKRTHDLIVLGAEVLKIAGSADLAVGVLLSINDINDEQKE
ncbi:hypothetical protein RZP38_24815, partial [Enterobacter cloacae]|uniref:hypothetical protein n=1 Tax=Enterobacter cloacae TaxID=550 RepID=UPI00292AF3AA